MKITAVLLLAALQVSANGWGQEQISLSFSNAPLEQVFNAITAQTSIAFLYRPEYVKDKKVTVKITNASLKAVLEVCLKDQKLVYQIVGKTVAIHPANKVNAVSGTEGVINTPPPPIDIRGRIVDSKGEAIPNATVSVKGSVKNTITNANGEFSLADVDENAVLIISHVQYEMESIVLKGNKNVTVSLQIKVNSLDEMQVIAYGTTTRRFNTGNVVTVQGKDVTKQLVSNPLVALQGRVPGLFITQSTGFTGGGVTTLVQGQNSLGKGNDPFFVIDGVPYVSQLLPNLGAVTGYSGVNITAAGNPLNYINPSDIESITVLKDADATAIYGSRAANGAILITTKKGKAGETRFDFDVQNGWGKVSRKLDLMNTAQFLEMRKEALKNDGTVPGDFDFDLNLWDSTRYTDWQKVLLGGTAGYFNASASASGGNVTTQFLIGATYHRETTVFPGSFSDVKGAMHFAINNTSRDQKLKIQLSGNYMVDHNRIPNNDLTSYATLLAPNAPEIYNPDGTFNWAPAPIGMSSWNNPMAQFLNKYNNKTSSLISNATLGYQLLHGIFLNASFGYTNLQSNELITVPLLSIAPENRTSSQRGASYGNNNINSWIVEPNINFRRTVNGGKLDILIGTTIQRQNSNGQLVSGRGYNSDEVLENMGAAARLTSISSTIATYKYNAVFGRVTYNLLDKYIVNLSGRRDGSSRFGSENMFHNFGALGAGWIFSQEAFFKKAANVLSFGKLRASYGTTGNDQILDYQYLSLYRPVNVGTQYQNATGLTPTGLNNPYLQWEETKKLSFGFDLGLLRDRILLNVDYYRNRSSNQLVQNTLPVLTGFPFITKNFPAIVQNTGWEITLESVNIKSKGFEWRTRLNATIPKNKLVKYDSLSTSSDANRLRIGEPITLIRVYHYLGVDPSTGLYTFEDAKGGVTSNPSFPNDLMVNINTSPVLYGGLENIFTYKGFELDVLFQFVKRKGINYVFGANNPGFYFTNQPVSVLDRWKKPGDDSPNQKYSSDGTVNTAFEAAANRSDASYIDASFIRLKTLHISWQLPQNWYRGYVNNIKLFAQGQNLATITDYKGLDPETLSSSTLPPLRVFTIGLHVGL